MSFYMIGLLCSEQSYGIDNDDRSDIKYKQMATEGLILS